MPIFGGDSPTHGQTLGSVVLGDNGYPFQITNLSWPDLGARESIDVGNMNILPTTAADGIGNELSIPSAYAKCGRLVLKVLHDPTAMIPINGPVDTVVVKLGPATSAQEQFDGFGYMTKYDLDGPMDGKALEATVEIKMTDVLDDGAYTNTGGVVVTVADS